MKTKTITLQLDIDIEVPANTPDKDLAELSVEVSPESFKVCDARMSGMTAQGAPALSGCRVTGFTTNAVFDPNGETLYAR